MKDYPERIDSKFRFVLLAATRAEQMMLGAPAKNAAIPGKTTDVAMEEICQDLVEWDYGPAKVTVEEAEAAEAAAAEAADAATEAAS